MGVRPTAGTTSGGKVALALMAVLLAGCGVRGATGPVGGELTGDMNDTSYSMLRGEVRRPNADGRMKAMEELGGRFVWVGGGLLSAAEVERILSRYVTDWNQWRRDGNAADRMVFR